MIVTDHKLLTLIFKMNDPSSRIMRLKLKLEEFDYTILFFFFNPYRTNVENRVSS